MNEAPISKAELLANARARYEAGDAEAACRLLQSVTEADPGDVSAWIALANVRRRIGHVTEALDATTQALRLDASNLPAHILKADLYAQAGDDVSAYSFYSAVTAQFSKMASVPSGFQGEAQRCAQLVETYQRKLVAHLKESLTAAGFDPAHSSERMVECVDLMLGTKRPYIEEPKSFFIPGLPSRCFYDPAEFGWAGDMSRGFEEIAAELTAALSRGAAFEPYMAETPQRPVLRHHPLANDIRWSALHLFNDGEPVPDLEAVFPNTFDVLKRAPLETVPGRAPMALFSRLLPGTRIESHVGLVNSRLICHLPIIAPKGNFLRVGNHTREFEPGKLVIFNDTISHEAVNSSPEPRINLIFSVWRPELSSEERGLASAIISSSVSYAGSNG